MDGCPSRMEIRRAAQPTSLVETNLRMTHQLDVTYVAMAFAVIAYRHRLAGNATVPRNVAYASLRDPDEWTREDRGRANSKHRANRAQRVRACSVSDFPHSCRSRHLDADSSAPRFRRMTASALLLRAGVLQCDHTLVLRRLPEESSRADPRCRLAWQSRKSDSGDSYVWKLSESHRRRAGLLHQV